MTRSALLLGLSLAVSTLAWAQKPTNPTSGASEAYDRCVNKAGGDHASVAHCQTAELKRQNTDLDAAFKRLLRRLPAAHRTSLQTSEQGWLKRRDAKCAVADKHQGDAASALTAQACLITETANRTEILRSGHG